MITQDERRALIFLAVVAAAGAGVRAVRPDPGGALPAAVAPELAEGDLVRQASASLRAESLARPLAPGERVDVNHATAEELDRLPRVGAALARRIVAEREARGPFHSLAELTRVAGVGPRLLQELEPHVSFDGVPPVAPEPPGSPAPAPAAIGGRPAPASPECPERVEVNRATAAQLTCLPGVGPALADRLVAERTAHGPFRDIGDLARVPGLGPKRIARLASRVTIP